MGSHRDPVREDCCHLEATYHHMSLNDQPDSFINMSSHFWASVLLLELTFITKHSFIFIYAVFSPSSHPPLIFPSFISFLLSVFSLFLSAHPPFTPQPSLYSPLVFSCCSSSPPLIVFFPLFLWHLTCLPFVPLSLPPPSLSLSSSSSSSSFSLSILE